MPNNKWLDELKTTFQVAKARLDVREKKKTEQVAKERYVIADYVRNNKVPRARIAVEHMIREDYKVEAMDRIEAYIDTLLMRLQILKNHQKNAPVDPSIEQPLANILWAAPFLAQDIPELAKVTMMLKKYFGPEYVSACESNKLSLVDVDLVRCLSCDHVPQLLIEKYLIEICRSQNIPFEPRATVMVQDEFWTLGSQYTGTVSSSSDEKPFPPPSSYGGGSSGGGASANSNFVPSSAPPPVARFENPPPAYPAGQAHYPHMNEKPTVPPPQFPGNPANGHFIGFAAAHQQPAMPPVQHNFPEVPRVDPPPAARHSSDSDPNLDDLARRFEMLKKQK